MRPALALLVALCVLVSALVGGQRYFYCALMEEVSLDSCCEPASAASYDSYDSRDSREDVPAIDREACCKTERFATPAPGTFAPEEPVLRAPLAAWLAAVAPIALRAEPEPARLARVARAGPGQPSSRESRLRLMVFRT